MKKWLIGYWKIKNDQSEDFETIINSRNLDDAYKEFRERNPLVKIRYIQETL